METRTVITLPYQVARTPLAIFDIKVMHRFADDSPRRLAFDRAFGSLDLIAGRLLHDDGLKLQGTERMDRAGKLARALDLEQDAAARRRNAREAERAAEDEAAAKREQAQQRAADSLHEAAETEAREKREAAKTARAEASKGKQHASARANQKLSTIQQNLEQTEAITEAREHQAEEKAKAEFDNAAQEKSKAHAQREDADQLSELVEAKKAERKDA